MKRIIKTLIYSKGGFDGHGHPGGMPHGGGVGHGVGHEDCGSHEHERGIGGKYFTISRNLFKLLLHILGFGGGLSASGANAGAQTTSMTGGME